MGNRSIWIAGALMLFIGLLFASRVNEKNYPTKSSIPSGTVLSIVTGMPLQQEIEILRQFFFLIQQHQTTKAIEMMSEATIQDEKGKRAWEKQLNAIESVKVISIDTSLLGEWTNTQHTYRVTLEMQIYPSSINGTIPYYGYENGTNIRFISLVKSGEYWKIEGISTGP